MQESLVSGVLSDEALQEIRGSIQAIRERMPFLVDVTSEQHRTLLRLGDRSEGFVRKARDVANANPEILPGAFDLDELNADIELYFRLQRIRTEMVQLMELVDDTTSAVGADALGASLAIYRFAKLSNVDGLDELRDAMAERFNRGRRSATSETETTAETA